MNKVLLLGYLSNDPEIKNFESKINNEESTLAKVNIAVNDNKNRDVTYFVNCVAWNQVAKYIGEKLHKGDFVAIDGRLTNRNYVNNEGKKVYITEVQIDAIRNYGSKKSSESEEEKNETSHKEPEYVVIDKTNKEPEQDSTTAVEENQTNQNDWENDLD